MSQEYKTISSVMYVLVGRPPHKMAWLGGEGSAQQKSQLEFIHKYTSIKCQPVKACRNPGKETASSQTSSCPGSEEQHFLNC